MTAQVALAIATFRQDEAVCRLLDRVLATSPDLFEQVFVVDSCGTGAVQQHIHARGWSGVTVHDSPENLGSAGNLAKRLELAADASMDWVYAVNHDGEVEPETVRRLLTFAAGAHKVGAAYPRRYVPGRDRFDVTGTRALPLPFLGRRSGAQTKDEVEVHWASSNGALYNLKPVRAGLLPWADLWMGWEDLGYGGLLERHGWKQYLVPGTRFVDDREYLEKRVLGWKVTISDKPSWYAYYTARNLLLVSRRNQKGPVYQAVALARIGLEGAVTVAAKREKFRRLGYLTAGIRDGLLGRSGHWRVP